MRTDSASTSLVAPNAERFSSRRNCVDAVLFAAVEDDRSVRLERCPRTSTWAFWHAVESCICDDLPTGSVAGPMASPLPVSMTCVCQESVAFEESRRRRVRVTKLIWPDEGAGRRLHR